MYVIKIMFSVGPVIRFSFGNVQTKYARYTKWALQDFFSEVNSDLGCCIKYTQRKLSQLQFNMEHATDRKDTCQDTECNIKENCS